MEKEEYYNFYNLVYPIDYEIVKEDENDTIYRAFGISSDRKNPIESAIFRKNTFQDEKYNKDQLANKFNIIERNHKKVIPLCFHDITNVLSFFIGGISFASIFVLIIWQETIGFTNPLLLFIPFITFVASMLKWDNYFDGRLEMSGKGIPVFKRLSFYKKYAKELNKQYEEINKLGFNNSIDFGINFPITKKDIYLADDLKKYKKIRKEFKKIIKEHREEIEYIRYQDSIKKPEVLELPNEKEDILGTINEVENRFSLGIDNTRTNQRKKLIKK